MKQGRKEESQRLVVWTRRRRGGQRFLVPEEGIEPTLSQGERDFESRASASSATPARRGTSIIAPAGPAPLDYGETMRSFGK
jgi:hypothetical protein